MLPTRKHWQTSWSFVTVSKTTATLVLSAFTLEGMGRRHGAVEIGRRLVLPSGRVMRSCRVIWFA